MTTAIEYISCADTAKLVRRELKTRWPGVKFSVRSKIYSMGASIDVSWTDGPREPEVTPTAKRFEGADFDGSIDLKTNKSHWMAPDGTVTRAHAEGTESSRGTLPQIDHDSPQPGARRVEFMADYVFCTRHISNMEEQATICRQYIREHCQTEGSGSGERCGADYVDMLAYRMAYDRAEGEDWAAPFRRVVLRES